MKRSIKNILKLPKINHIVNDEKLSEKYEDSKPEKAVFASFYKKMNENWSHEITLEVHIEIPSVKKALKIK